LERGCGLRGDRRVAAAGVSDTDAEPQTAKASAGSKMSEHRPWLKLSVDSGGKPRDTEVLRFDN
jgi:hypothetical protein